MELTVEQAHQIADNCAADVEVREDYSGRGMYGETCVGLVVEDTADLLATGFAAAEEGIDYRALPKRTDSMGRSIIVY